MNIEHWKLLVSFISPVVILFLGIWAKEIAANHEKRISLTDKIIEKRVSIYEEIGQELNDLYAFIIRVGHWKELTPQKIIDNKRFIDQKMYKNRPYFSDSTFKKYEVFMEACFETWIGSGEDAKIKASPASYQILDIWNKNWTSYFNDKDSNLNVSDSYAELMAAFSDEFGFTQS